MCLTAWVDPVLASAGDDGVVCIWVPSDSRDHAFGDTTEQHAEDKESWRVKHMCRSSGSEIYDLVWSPDGIYILTGSMDNIARIYDSRDGCFVLCVTNCRAMYSKHWRTQSLCAGCGLGSPGRVHSYSKQRSFRPHLGFQNAGRTIHIIAVQSVD